MPILTIRSRTVRSRRSITVSLQQNSIRSIQPSHENGLLPSDLRVRQESCSQRVRQNSSSVSRYNETRHLLSVCIALLVASTMHVSTRIICNSYVLRLAQETIQKILIFLNFVKLSC